MPPTVRRLTALVGAALVFGAIPTSAQPRWVEVQGPTVTVLSDAGAGRARDIAWQFEQVREALARTFPWVRWNLSRPLMVFAARNEQTMRTLAPALFERPDGQSYASVSASGRDRAFVALRADVRFEDREGINPYQSAYWSYAAQALGETTSGLPLWLFRGLTELLSNTVVRDQEILIGRVLPTNLRTLRAQGRVGLKELVAMPRDDRRLQRPDFLGVLDANAWAFVHFLLFADEAAHRPAVNAFVTGILDGVDPAALFATTIGDVSRFETAFSVYVNRELFGYLKYVVSAKVSREGFVARDVPPAESTALQAALHVAMNRPAEAKALIATLQETDPGGAGEALALLADREDRDDDVLTNLEDAVARKRHSWYAPYRLATLLPRGDAAALRRIETLLDQATSLNPNADYAWAFLGEVKAGLDRGDAALEPIRKAIALVPASSSHRVSLARVLRRLDRRADALKAAGIARALARTETERTAAQGMLADLARDALRAAEAANAAATAPEPSVAGPADTPAVAGAPVDPAELASATADGRDSRIGDLIDACFSDSTTCRKALPDIAGDCNGGGTVTSPAACRNAGYILDIGLGVPSTPTAAADFYRKGCARKDDVSCVRLATLQAQGRGVRRDVAAALGVLEAACKNDLQEACFRLGVQLSSTKTPADTARAREVLSTSCAAGFPESCDWLKKFPPQ